MNTCSKKGLTKKELPQSIDAYRNALKKHLAVHNGKHPHLDRRALYPAARKKEVTLCQEHRAFPTRCGGKLTKEFEVLYDELHIAGYYRGLHLNANIIK